MAKTLIQEKIMLSGILLKEVCDYCVNLKFQEQSHYMGILKQVEQGVITQYVCYDKNQQCTFVIKHNFLNLKDFTQTENTAESMIHECRYLCILEL